MTVPLQENEVKALQNIIGGNIRLSLLYKISRDGCNASTFHTKCDCQGPTITVFYNTNDTVYGGYTSQSWLGAGTEYSAYDEKAFLFQVRFNGSSVQKKYSIKSDKYATAISCRHDLGPVFGKGEPDIPFFTGNVAISNGIFTLSKGMPNNTYINVDIAALTNDSVDVRDLEVYKVEEGIMPSNFNCWRTTPTWNTKFLQSLKKDVEEYVPLEETGVEQVKVLLIGQVGAGKSSFFNTINSIFKGTITNQASVGSTEKSLTTKYRMYQVRNGRMGKPLNFRLCDTKGLEKDDGIDPHEFCYILDGNMPDKYMFNASSQLSPDSPGFLTIPSTKDKTHIVVIVLDATVVDVFPDEIIEKIKKLQDKCNQKGIPQVVLLSKIDRFCKALEVDVSKTFSVPQIEELVNKVSALVGLPRGSIIPIKNYECEMELRMDINILALLALRQILNFADDYLTNFLDF